MDVNTKFNYYDILEIGVHSPQHEVTTAYERLKMTYSGDNPAIYTIFSDEEAREMLRMVEEAFATLGNKNLRHQYDEKIIIKTNKTPEAEPVSAKSKSLEIPKKAGFLKPNYSINIKLEDEISACLDWDGEMIKRVRTYKNWKVDALAELTKISAYYIVAIEALDMKSLPAPVFVRGYVAQLSKVLGLDEKKVCDSYMKHYKKKAEEV